MVTGRIVDANALEPAEQKAIDPNGSSKTPEMNPPGLSEAIWLSMPP
jgi:hypothetical protein